MSSSTGAGICSRRTRQASIAVAGDDGATKQEVWDDWTTEYVETGQHVPLFATDEGGVVETEPHGRADRQILQHHSEMVDQLAPRARGLWMTGRGQTTRTKA